jgi:hypothetical protein
MIIDLSFGQKISRFYPKIEKNWTGYVKDNGTFGHNMESDEIRVTQNKRIGWTLIDISELPVGTQILSSELGIYPTNVSGFSNPKIYYRAFLGQNVNPLIDDEKTFYKYFDIDRYYFTSTGLVNNEYNSISTDNSYIESAIGNNENWVGMAFTTFDFDADFNIEGYSSNQLPVLLLKYEYPYEDNYKNDNQTNAYNIGQYNSESNKEIVNYFGLTEEDEDWFKFYYNNQEYYILIKGGNIGPYGFRFTITNQEVKVKTFESEDNYNTDTKVYLYEGSLDNLLIKDEGSSFSYISYSFKSTSVNSIKISGSNEVNENSSENYICEAKYYDGSIKNVTNLVSWSVDSYNATISSSGVLNTLSVNTDENCEINASYKGKYDSHGITIRNGSATENKPDLIGEITYISSTTINPEQEIEFKTKVSNIGHTTSNSTKANYYLSKNDTYEEGFDIEIGNDFIDPIEPENNSIERETVTIPAETEFGEWYVIYLVDAEDEVDEIYNSNNIDYAQISVVPVNNKPDKAILISPEDDVIVRDDFKLEWTGSDPDGDDLKYKIQWENEPGDFKEESDFYNGFDAESGMLISIQFWPTNTKAYWRVVSYDGIDLSYSDYRAVTVVHKEINLIAPVDETIFHSSGIKFSWESDFEDTLHHLKIVTVKSGEETIEYVNTKNKEIELSRERFDLEADYYLWSVEVDYKKYNRVVKSEERKFYIKPNEKPSVPILLEPENHLRIVDGDSLRIKWELSIDPDNGPEEIKYSINEYSDSDGNDLIGNIGEWYSETEIFYPRVDGSGDYYFRLVASDGADETLSDVFHIFLKQRYNPVLKTPKKDAVGLSVLPVLKWEYNGSSGVDFNVQIDKGNGFETITHTKEDFVNYSTLNLEQLQYEKTYSWRIIASSDIEYGESEIWSFTTEKLDDINPEFTISSSENDPTNSEKIGLIITASEEVTGLELSDLTIGNCSVSNLQTDNNVDFALDVEPINDGEVSIRIGENIVEDLAGNGNVESNEFSIIYDGTSPRATFEYSGNSLSNLDAFVVNVAFSEEVSGFELSDLEYDNCSLENLNTNNNVEYSINVNPIGVGLITLDLDDNKVIDLAGNANLKTDQWSISVTGIKSLQELGLQLYPNPIKDYLTISSSEYSTVTVQVLTTTGKVIFTEEWQSPFTRRINFSNFSNGLYFIRFTINGEMVTQKVMLVK